MDAVVELTILEEEEGGEGANAVGSGEGGMIIDVHFHDRGEVAGGGCGFFESGDEKVAGAAPRSPEVDGNGF